MLHHCWFYLVLSLHWWSTLECYSTAIQDVSKSPALGAENLLLVAPVSVQPKTCPESAGPQGARQEHWNSGLGNIPTYINIHIVHRSQRKSTHQSQSLLSSHAVGHKNHLTGKEANLWWPTQKSKDWCEMWNCHLEPGSRATNRRRWPKFGLQPLLKHMLLSQVVLYKSLDVDCKTCPNESKRIQYTRIQSTSRSSRFWKWCLSFFNMHQVLKLQKMSRDQATRALLPPSQSITNRCSSGPAYQVKRVLQKCCKTIQTHTVFKSLWVFSLCNQNHGGQATGHVSSCVLCVIHLLKRSSAHLRDSNLRWDSVQRHCHYVDPFGNWLSGVAGNKGVLEDVRMTWKAKAINIKVQPEGTGDTKRYKVPRFEILLRPHGALFLLCPSSASTKQEARYDFPLRPSPTKITGQMCPASGWGRWFHGTQDLFENSTVKPFRARPCDAGALLRLTWTDHRLRRLRQIKWRPAFSPDNSRTSSRPFPCTRHNDRNVSLVFELMQSLNWCKVDKERPHNNVLKCTNATLNKLEKGPNFGETETASLQHFSTSGASIASLSANLRIGIVSFEFK